MINQSKSSYFYSSLRYNSYYIIKLLSHAFLNSSFYKFRSKGFTLNSGELMSSNLDLLEKSSGKAAPSEWLFTSRSSSVSDPRKDMIRAKLDLKNLEISFGDREFGLGFRDLSEFEVMFRLKRLPEMVKIKTEINFGKAFRSQYISGSKNFNKYEFYFLQKMFQ